MTTDAVVVDVSQEWVAACDLQERFMQAPRARIETLTCHALCRQMRALGGDCFDYLPLSGHRVALAIADASGKGLAAALMMANVQSSLRTAAAFAPNEAAAVVTAVNRQAHASSPLDRYATLFYGVFDEETRTLQYVNAGHNPPIVIRGGDTMIRLEGGGPPVGIFADSIYRAGMVQLNPGDVIVAYTDGVVEAVDSTGEEWGVYGLLAAVTAAPIRQPDRIVEAAFAALDEHSRNCQTDDATILVACVH
jgi:sigma-B regulation protein RsbU (phosphoserine phosphatase)